MSYQLSEMSRFDADAADRPGADMRLVRDPWPAPTCVHCGRKIEYSGECDECRAIEANEGELPD